MRRFIDRKEAGLELAATLHSFAHKPDVVVIALPRGGVPVAREVAEALEVPLDVLTVQKLELKDANESCIGAIAADGPTTVDWRTADSLRVSDVAIDALIAREREDLVHRDRFYRMVKPVVDIAGKTVLVIDDGVASGTTMTTAIAALRKRRPARVVVAAPVASRQAQDVIYRLADAAIFLYTPHRLYSVGLWYENYSPVTDAEVMRVLQRDTGRRLTPSSLTAHA